MSEWWILVRTWKEAVVV